MSNIKKKFYIPIHRIYLFHTVRKIAFISLNSINRWAFVLQSAVTVQNWSLSKIQVNFNLHRVVSEIQITNEKQAQKTTQSCYGTTDRFRCIRAQKEVKTPAKG